MSASISLRKLAVSLAMFALVTLASATFARADTVTFNLNRGSTLPNQNYGTVTLTLAAAWEPDSQHWVQRERGVQLHTRRSDWSYRASRYLHIGKLGESIKHRHGWLWHV